MALTFRAASDAQITAGQVLTTSFTCPSEFQQVLIIATSQTGTQTITSVTYAGSALTFLGGGNDGVAGRTEVWYIKNPATGANNLVVTWGGAVAITGTVGICVYSGADVTDGGNNPVDGFATSSGAVSVATQNATLDVTNSGGVSGQKATDIVFAVMALTANSAPAPAGGETQRWTRTPSATLRGYGVEEFGSAGGTTNILIDSNVAAAATYVLSGCAIHKDPTLQMSLNATETPVATRTLQARATRSATETPVATRAVRANLSRSATETPVATRVVNVRSTRSATETPVATRTTASTRTLSATETPVATRTLRTNATRSATETPVATRTLRVDVIRSATETPVATRVAAISRSMSITATATPAVAAVKGFLFNILRRKNRQQRLDPPEVVV